MASVIWTTLVLNALPVGANDHAEREDQVNVGGGAHPGAVDVRLSTREKTSRTTPRSGARRVSKVPAPKPYALVELKLRSDPRGGAGPDLNGQEGTWCVVRVVHASATPFPAARIARTARINRRIEDLGHPLCARLITDAARDLSVTLVLPSPRPEIDPGWAITGLRAFLETRGTVTYDSGPIETEWGTMIMQGTGEYFVDWGDDTGWFGPYGFEGMAWPEGRITHLYRHTGTYTVKVRQLWTLHWRVGERRGTLTDRFTESTLTLPVRELQPVRIR